MKKKPSYWPRFQVDHDFLELMVRSKLALQGIHDVKTYFQIWRVRIRVWVVLCGCSGFAIHGLAGMLIGVIVGLAMPVVLVYLSVIVPILLVQLLGLVLGICWVWFCCWAIFTLLFG